MHTLANDRATVRQPQRGSEKSNLSRNAAKYAAARATTSTTRPAARVSANLIHASRDLVTY